MADPPTEAALEALLRVARSTAVAGRVAGDAETTLLQSVVDAAATLFEAQGASIALYAPETEQLVFRVASGAQGEGVVGLAIPTTQGIAGYVFSTGDGIALSDVPSDPRFDADTAERTGYVPRSIAAVPLTDAGATVGVLQVLDKEGEATFSLHDMQLLGVFADQAAAALAASRVGRDAERLLRTALEHIGEEDLGEDELDALVSAAATELDREDEAPFWRLVDRLALVRELPDADLELVAEILELVGRRRAGTAGYRRRRFGTRGR